MPSTYSNLKFELIAPGEQAGTWGTTTNTNLGTAVEEAVTGSVDVTFSSADVTLTLNNSNASQAARNLRLNLVGTSSGAHNLILGAGCQIDKLYLVQNNLAHAVTVKNTTGNGIAVPAGRVQFVFNNGTDVVEATSASLPSQTGNNGKFLSTNGTQTSWETVTAGSGDVVGPASATDNNIALFDGTTGKLIKNSGLTATLGGTFRVGAIASDNQSVAIGTQSPLGLVTTGTNNTAVGSGAGNGITSGANNTFMGYGAGATLETGSQNTYVGHASGPISNAASGNDNTGVGFSVLTQATTGEANTAVGRAALSSTTTGSNNTAIGNVALSLATTGSNNTAVGYLAGRNGSPFNVGTESNRVIIGNDQVTNAYVRVAWTVTSDARDKTDFAPLNFGLNVIDQIATYTFRFDNRSAYYVYDENGNVISSTTPDGTHKTDRLFTGFSAQQVKSVLDAEGYPENIIVDAEDPENLKMKETAFIPLLINSIKELKAELDVVKAELAALKG